MKICAVDGRETLTAWQAVNAASLAHDHAALPADPLDERLALLDPTLPEAGEKTLMRVGFVDDEPVATAELNLPTRDNLSAVSIDVHVAPGARRSGHGRVLLAAVLDETAAMGRSRVFFEAPSPYPSGAGPADALLTSVGARPVLKEVRRLLDLRAVAAAEAPTPPDGFRLLQWVDRVPDEHVEDMAYLMHRMSTDAPLEDMDWEPEVWDAARYRDKEASAAAKGRTRVGTLAVQVATGRVVAFTDIGVSRFDPTTAYQWETIVAPEHRGHGLGYVVKAHNHRLLAERSPSSRWLNTWNAESNTHMVGINVRLGFRPMEYWSEWQLDR